MISVDTSSPSYSTFTVQWLKEKVRWLLRGTKSKKHPSHVPCLHNARVLAGRHECKPTDPNTPQTSMNKASPKKKEQAEMMGGWYFCEYCSKLFPQHSKVSVMSFDKWTVLVWLLQRFCAKWHLLANHVTLKMPRQTAFLSKQAMFLDKFWKIQLPKSLDSHFTHVNLEKHQSYTAPKLHAWKHSWGPIEKLPAPHGRWSLPDVEKVVCSHHSSWSLCIQI